MATTLPDHVIAPLKRLAEMPQAERARLIDSVIAAKPTMDQGAFVAQVFPGDATPSDREIVYLLSGIATGASEFPPQPIERAVKELLDVAKAAAGFPEPTGGWDVFASEIVRAIGQGTPLAYTAKAVNVTHELPNVLRDVRIVSDIRPIFPNVAGEKPTIATIIHTLRIRYRNMSNNNGGARFFAAMDSEDLLLLKRAVERALEKDALLREVIETAGMTTADPEKRSEQ